MMKALLLMILVILAVACGAGTPSAAAGPWSSRAAAVAVFEAAGFTGSESPLADGTPRWLARGANSSSAEVIGAEGAVRAVSLTTVVNGAGGKLTGTILGTFLPGSTSWVSDQLTSHDGVDFGASKDFAGGSVQVQTLNATDGTIAIMTVTRAP